MKFRDLSDEIKISIIVFINNHHSSDSFMRESDIIWWMRHMKIKKPSATWKRYKDKLLDLGILNRLWNNPHNEYVYWISDDAKSWIRNVYLSVSVLRNE